jgi:hypothetical protein
MGWKFVVEPTFAGLHTAQVRRCSSNNAKLDICISCRTSCI